MAPALGIIADDFTGAVMVASYLETAGIACPVAFDAAALRDDEAALVLMAGSRTRLIPADAAQAETARLIAHEAERFADLTERELSVVRLVAQGMDNREIASTLFLSEGTVRNHISSILSKKALSNRTQIAVLYYRG